ncbi:unnamed protein product, partial [Musa hybrid cultivar]
RRCRVLVFGIYCTASVDIPWVDSPVYEVNRECLGKASARTMFDEVIVVLLAIGVAGTEVVNSMSSREMEKIDAFQGINSLFCSSLYATHMLEAVKRTKIKEVILHFAPHTG